ncbi:pyruvate dehydrogenase (acetyl-transferring) E1 component subunit alpha [Pseudobacteriovorax antillogorgiicola]|uniref:Pyruvate dehydrogenase E1 component subunit alpha n=1 Tax=Pseudobacteriovorax antillogorgiicola TaxID=1513793 RepID=A0A1Y6CQN1_9BACT|nr:pyruvate dehydrogenase (acetyl-transferring) E1 component subunit alpha [Pseudobacteriovorax antillogorgiicola]TCS41471.1 pyruvate dehydrogenase E1 component alpha subunit [Pseudobacteriovorax antillogorgiicola]SMF83629.1 pyruvate dehydrogenase E1 component alpha subunit [Pseudobacteriovorax antillogorgiicola]
MAKKKTNLDKEQLFAMYKQMCLFRRFEERVGLAYTKRKFSGFCHLHIGQEGLAVGVQNSLRDSDYMISGYRSHTQAIGKGIEPKQVMAELFGKVDGICRGKGGSMHMFSESLRFLGGHGIVGGQVPLAAGVGFAIRYREEDDVCVCYLGDAATNQGQFFEALNMAATWDLPVLFIIENNKYGMGTDIRRTTSIDHLWKRALSFDMDHSDCDGMNVITVQEHVSKIVEKMRKDKKPHLLEALTYRYRGHSVSDPGTYRTKKEVEDYQKNKDPIKQLGKYLVENDLSTEEQLKEWDTEAKDQVKAAEAFADESPNPPIEELWDHVLV